MTEGYKGSRNIHSYKALALLVPDMVTQNETD